MIFTSRYRIPASSDRVEPLSTEKFRLIMSQLWRQLAQNLYVLGCAYRKQAKILEFL